MTEPTIDEILDKLWKDAWGKLGAYNFDGTGEDTLTKDQAKKAIERIISDQVAKARIELLTKMLRDNHQKPIPEKYALDLLAQLITTKEQDA